MTTADKIATFVSNTDSTCNFCHCRFIEGEPVLVFDYCDDASVWDSEYCSTKCFVNDMLKNEYLVISEFTNLDTEVKNHEHR